MLTVDTLLEIFTTNASNIAQFEVDLRFQKNTCTFRKVNLKKI